MITSWPSSKTKPIGYKYILGCAIGNFLEWYDFILYSFFATTLADLFFPNNNKFISLLLTFAVFASACIVRPFSGLVFGYIGDRFGRKTALVYSIIFITLATTLMGVLPSYQAAGVLAPILLVCCRLLQGIAVSAEEVGAAILLIENAPTAQRTFMGSIILASVYIGLFFGACTALLVFTCSSPKFLANWGWRIPFLAAAPLGILALRLRLTAFDSRAFLQLQDRGELASTPIKTIFATYWRTFIQAIAISTILAVAIYIFAVYLPSYYINLAGFDRQDSLLISAIFLLLISGLVLLVGYYAYQFDSRRVMRVGCIGLCVFSYLIFWLLAQKNLGFAIVAEAILVLFLALIAGCVLSLVIDLFPTEVRYTGACTSFNISMTVFGSTAPMIMLSLHTFFQSPIAPCLYLFAAGLLSFIALGFKPVPMPGKPLLADG